MSINLKNIRYSNKYDYRALQDEIAQKMSYEITAELDMKLLNALKGVASDESNKFDIPKFLR